MTDFQHILFPVDFSPICYASVPAVKDIVRRYKARLTLLHVVEIPLAWYGSMASAMAEDWDILETVYQAAQETVGVRRQLHRSLHGRPSGNLCDKGDPAAAIRN